MPSAPIFRHLQIDLSTASDQELVNEFLRPGLGQAERAEHAFRGLVERHLPMVRAVCQRALMNDADSDDAAQAVFLVLWKRAGEVPVSALGGWLHRTATLVSRNVQRSHRNRQKHERRSAAMSSEMTSDPTDWEELREVLDGELDRLADKYRVPLIMFHLEERPVQEIAAALAVSENTIGTWLVRGRELLAKRLVRRGIVVGAVALAAGLTREVLAEPVSTQAVATAIAEASQFGGVVSTVIEGDTSAAVKLAKEVLSNGHWTPWKWAVGGFLTIAAGLSLTAGAGLFSGDPVADNPPPLQRAPVWVDTQSSAGNGGLEVPAGRNPPLEDESDLEYGGIRGQITVDEVVTQPVVTRDPKTNDEIVDESLLVDPQTRGLKNVVVYLKNAPARIVPSWIDVPNTTLVVDNMKGAFVPHLVITRKGQSIVFKNGNSYSINVHTMPSRNERSNFLLKPFDRAGASITFSEAESLPFSVTDDIHAWMRAYILPLDHPYAAVTDQDGKFHINHLPAGKHSFRIWHEKVGYIQRDYSVEVLGGKLVDLSLTVQAKKLKR